MISALEKETALSARRQLVFVALLMCFIIRIDTKSFDNLGIINQRKRHTHKFTIPLKHQ